MDLSVIITTYNRRECLKRTLELLSKQTKDQFNIIISDNCSSYDVLDVIKGFSLGFKKRIIVMKNPANIGMVGNIASCFTKMTGDWCWFLADDDLPRLDAVETIYEDILFAQEKNVGVIQYPHYSIPDEIIKTRVIINDLSEYASYSELLYKNGVTLTNVQGSNIWLSNKVYCRERVLDYIQFAFQYANTGIPQTIPILKMLEKQSSKFLVHNKIVVEYPVLGDEQKSWNVCEIALGTSTLSYLPLDVDFEVKRRVWYYLMLKYKYVLEDYRKKGKTDLFFLQAVYNNMFKYILTEKENEFFVRLIELAKNEKEIEFLSKMEKVDAYN